MIQEIYVYLLIRHCFINSSTEEMETWIDNKKIFDNVLKKVVAIMQMEDFFLISDTVMNNLECFIQNNRFKYVDKDSVSDINYLISRLNYFKNLSDDKRESLINEFCRKEYDIRNLPRNFQSYSNVYEFISFDLANFMNIFPPDELRNGGEENKIVTDLTSFISTINLLVSLCPNDLIEFEEDDQTISQLLEVLNKLLNAPRLPHFYLSYIKKTVNNLKKAQKGKIKVKEFAQDMRVNFC